MTKNFKNFKNLFKITNLPFFGTVGKGDSLFTSIPFLKNFFKPSLNKNSIFVKSHKEGPSVFFSNYRIRARTLITTNWKQLNNIQFIIALFPFVFSFSLLIRSRYKGQLFSYLVKDNLPGFCLPHQDLSWETFREITSNKIASFSDDKSYICKPPNTLTDKSETKTEFLSEICNPSNSDFGDVQILENNVQMLESDFSPRELNSFTSRIESKEKQANLQNQDLIERLDIYSNLILLEMKSTWEQKQKQFYIGFLPKEKKVTLNTLPAFFHGKQNEAEKAFANKNEIFVTTNKLMALQTENSKPEKVSKYKFYARKPNFLSFYKNKNDLKLRLINKKPNLINVFLRQPFQQELFDLDELPLKLDQNYSGAKENTNETSLAVNKPGQNDSILEVYQSNVKEETFSKKSFLENELKKSFYNEGFIPSRQNHRKGNEAPLKNLQKCTNQFTYLDLNSSFTNRESEASRRFAKFLSNFSNEEKNINDGKEFDFFDSIQTLILNSEKNDINLTLPEQSFITQLRFLSGYKYPDMEIAKIRSLLIQNVYKNIIFQKLNTESLPLKIEVPSSFIYDLLNESNSLMSTSNKNKEHEVFVSFLKEKKPIFNFLTNHKLNFHYLPASQTLLNQNLIENSNVGGIYQKVFSIYKPEIKTGFIFFSKKRSMLRTKNLLLFLKPFLSFQKSRIPFRESWEPVTVHSWLAITKLSFAFIALKIFQILLLNYGKELVSLGFLDDNLKEEFGLTDKKKDKGYRLIKKVKKRFKDVAGIDNILPELGEMVWVLRNSGRSFKVGNVLPKGFLFVGPPGTGKTLLVQAIAGEAEVPVLVQSGSSLTDTEENEKGAQRLKNLFEQARKVAPCIVFIDEIDTLGESRQNVMRNPVGTDDLIQSLHKSNQGLTEKSSGSYVNSDKPGNITEKQNRGSVIRSENLQHTSYPLIGKKNQAKQQANQEQLSLLMQFLVELDGLKSRTGVIVIGATNRPKVLDPALTRPGRFDRVLNLEFPGKRKRIEILKLYSQNIGLTFSSTTISNKVQGIPLKAKESLRSDKTLSESKGKALLSTFEEKKLTSENKQTNISTNFSAPNNLGENKDRSKVFKNKKENLDFPWEYLANRTFGFSAADLAAAMNQSSIQAILRNTGHTIETIEQGIEFITSYSIEKPKIDSEKEKDPFFITRFAYYQAGKAVLHTLLPQHPDAIILKLWPQPKNSRHKNVNLQLTSINHRANLETRLIGLYAGKAAELLALCLNSHTKKQNINNNKTNDKIKEKTLTNRRSVSVENTLRKGYASKTKTRFSLKLASPTESLSCIPSKNSIFVKAQVSNFSQYDKRNLWHSSLGIEDLSVASDLAHSLVDKWHFYSNKTGIRRENQIFINQNQLETSEIEVFDLFQQLTEDMQNRVSASNISESNVLLNSSNLIERDKHSRYNFQELSIRPWWQNQITKQIGNLNMFYDDWYRIYLPDPEESERNEEWVTPDEYYHNTQNLKNLSSIPSFHSFNKKNNSYLLPTFKNLTNRRFLAGFLSQLDEKGIKEKKHVNKHKNLKQKQSLFSFQRNSEIKTGFLSKVFVKNYQTKNKLYFDITWNDLYKLDRDYIYHALILTCFNQAFCLLDENRELLDYLADYLMRFETLRQHKIKEIFYDFGSPKIENKSFFKNKQTEIKTEFEGPSLLSFQGNRLLTKNSIFGKAMLEGKKSLFASKKSAFATDQQKVKFIFDKKWGKNSRRNFSRFFSFDQQRSLSKKIYSRPFTFFETINK